jgi:hypothetical protein
MSVWGFAAVFVVGAVWGVYVALCWATGDGR